ncbi:response regulator [bacterium]|nr:response regulator [bacterium]
MDSSNKQYRVMIIDDNPSSRDLVSEILDNNYETYMFESGSEALAEIHKIMPHVVLLDIMMPEMDGYEVCRRIREDKKLSDIKVLFLSAKASLNDRLKAYEVKGDDYLIKPFDHAELQAKVNVHIRLVMEEEKRKQSEESLKTSEEKYRSLIDNSPDIIIHANRNGDIVFINRPIAGSQASSERNNIYDFIPDEFKESVKNKIESVFETGQISSYEIKLPDANGNPTWYATRVGPIRDEDEISGVTLIRREITDQKEIEEELRKHKDDLEGIVKERTNDLKKINDHLLQEIDEKQEAKKRLQKSEEKYRSILENIEEGYYELDMNGNLKFLNDSLAKILDASKDKLVDKKFGLLEKKVDISKLEKTLEYVSKSGKTAPMMKWEVPGPDGPQKFLESSISLIKDGEINAGFRGIIRDVTERLASEKSLERLFQYAVGTLARAAEVFDQDTGDHTIRIGNYSQLLSNLVGMNEQYQKDIQISAQLHDVGKIHITSAMLNKNGRLTDEEFESIKNHTLYGSIIIGRNPDFKMANEIAMFHHEKWNGTGYPDGLKGRAIPLAARITAIVDVFDALISKRSYKKAFSYKDAMTVLKEGDQRLNPLQSFDPKMLKIFLDHYDAFVAIHKNSLQAEQEFSGQRTNVLLLEDDKVLVKMIEEHFEDILSYVDILSFQTIKEMKDYLAQNPLYSPHICFLDVNLPDGIGHDAAADLKARYPESHLISITADEDINIEKVNLYGHRVFRKIPNQMDDFMKNLVKTTEIIREYHLNPFKL